MRMVFCLEASYERGLGHFYRSTRLVQDWRNQGLECEVLFLTNPDQKVEALIKAQSFNFQYYDKNSMGWEEKFISDYMPHIWINDRLDTDERHAENIKKNKLKLITFDDRGEGAALADLNIAPLIFNETLPGKKNLSGLSYLVIDAKLFRFKRTRSRIQSVLVAMGGTDDHLQTQMVLRKIADLPFKITALLGPLNTQEESIRKLYPSVQVVKNPRDLGGHFQDADLMISAGGMMPFEALATGLPVIACASEDFEKPVCRHIEKSGAGIYGGYRAEIESLDWSMLLSKIASEIENKSIKAQGLLDSQAGRRIYQELLQ